MKRSAWTARALSATPRRRRAARGRATRASRERGGSAGRTGGEVRYESSSSMSMSEKSSEVCDVSADMVTRRLPNERIVERSCEASLSERPKRCAFANGRGTSGSARAFVRELRRSSRDRERVGGGDVERRARVCARGARRAVVQNFRGKQASFYLLLSDSNLDARDTRSAVSIFYRENREGRTSVAKPAERQSVTRLSFLFCSRAFVDGFHLERARLRVSVTRLRATPSPLP